MILVFIFLFFNNFLCSRSLISSKNELPSADLNTVELILEYGYPVQKHTNIITEDGYILEMQRIPFGKNGPSSDPPIVLFMHGTFSSSIDWINAGPTKSLAFLLADRGYDVWLANARGTPWSNKHLTHDPEVDVEKFWSFSWEEIGLYDLPALIDYILATTNQNKLNFVGHSHGTTSFFVLASEKPEYNDKINLMVALAPISFMRNSRSSPLQVIYDNSEVWIQENVGSYEFLPTNEFLMMSGMNDCEIVATFSEICRNILFLMAGFDSGQFNGTMLPFMLANTPTRTSSKLLVHSSQSVENNYFRKFDYGLIKNLEMYGSVVPPNYRINQITCPIGVFYGINDWLSDSEDVSRFKSQLPNLVHDAFIPHQNWSNLDFLWSTDVSFVVDNGVMELLDRYQ